jgi:hypothetical protein
MKFVGVILVVCGVLAAVGAVQSEIESYAFPAIFALLGVGAIAQGKSKQKEE